MRKGGGQNVSSAVMQQRQEARDSLDDFPTPPWATRALVEKIIKPRWGLGAAASVLEPCCNRGHMVRPLAESFARVDSADAHDYSNDAARAVMPDGSAFQQARVCDFLFPGWEDKFSHVLPVDWIITNPPFVLSEQIVKRALRVAAQGVAIFQRVAFLEGAERCKLLFDPFPPTVIAQFAERVVLHKGCLRDPKKSYWDAAAGKWRKPSTATAYCWIVWKKDIAAKPGLDGTAFTWLGAGTRDALTRPGDYPASAVEEGPRADDAGLGGRLL